MMDFHRTFHQRNFPLSLFNIVMVMHFFSKGRYWNERGVYDLTIATELKDSKGLQVAKISLKYFCEE